MEQNNMPKFIIDDDPVIDWPVTVNLPTAGGEFTEYQFSVSMRVLSPSEYEELLDKRDEIPDTVAGDTEQSVETDKVAAKNSMKLSEGLQLNAPIFQRLIADWRGIKDVNGNDVAYSPELLAAQITGPRGPALTYGLWRAITEVRFGARLGN